MAETLKLAAVAMSARERAARFEGELIARCSRSWWKPGVRQKAAALPVSTNSSNVAIKRLEKPETRGARPLAVMQSLLRLRRAPLADVTALIVFAGFVVVFVKYGIPILAEP
jgi:hypothetical protein